MVRAAAYGMGLGAGAYATYAALTWARYGRVRPSQGEGHASLLDHFMPVCEVAERHHVRVAAPPGVAFTAACEVDLQRSRIVRGIFRTRELMLGGRPDPTERPVGLLAFTKALGWGVLAEQPGQEIVLGAVTRPWEANPIFRAVPPGEFPAFAEPYYVKIAWNLRVDSSTVGESVVRTETRVASTDSAARERFKPYWALASPGILLIRRVALGLVKEEAERRARRLDSLATSADRFDLVSTGDLDAEC